MSLYPLESHRVLPPPQRTAAPCAAPADRNAAGATSSLRSGAALDGVDSPHRDPVCSESETFRSGEASIDVPDAPSPIDPEPADPAPGAATNASLGSILSCSIAFAKNSRWLALGIGAAVASQTARMGRYASETASMLAQLAGAIGRRAVNPFAAFEVGTGRGPAEPGDERTKDGRADEARSNTPPSRAARAAYFRSRER